MGASSSNKKINTDKVEFRLPLQDLRIRNFNQYSGFEAGFQQRFGPAIWDEFKQHVTKAILQYTNDESKTTWKSSYSTLTYVSFVIGCLCAPSLIYSFYGGLLGGIMGASAVWQSAVVLVILVIIWTIIYFSIIRQKLKSWKQEYHDHLQTNINATLTELNMRYNGQCRFDLENILGVQGVDVDFNIGVRCCFRITLYVQMVQNPNYGGRQYVQQHQQQAQQPQQVMIQMPDGTMQLAQIVSQPAQPMVVQQQQQYMQQVRPQQQYTQQVRLPQQQQSQPVAYAPNAPPPAYAPNAPEAEAFIQKEGGEGGPPGVAQNAAHTLQ